ncbi:MAG: FtsX-like permease family protein [Deinococcota bacterium]
MSLLVRLALRNLLRHPWRSLATGFGVALGIAAVLATLSVGDNVQANVAGSLEAAAGKANLLVTPGAQGRAVFAIDDILEDVTNVAGIAQVYPVLNFRAEPVQDIQGVGDSIVPGLSTGFVLTGRVTSATDDLPAEVSSGTIPQMDSGGMALAESCATARDITLGDEMFFLTQFGEIPFEVVGLLDDSIGLGSTNGSRIGLINLMDLQEVLRLSGRASYLEILVNESSEVEDVRLALEDALPETYAVTYPAGSGDFAVGIVDTIEAGLQVLAATLIALAGFMAYNTFAASVVERAREYALLRTICLTRKQVRQLAMIEALLLSIVGVIVGIAAGAGLAYVITRVNTVLLGFAFRTLVLPVSSLIIASVLGVGVSLLAGALPAMAAGRTRPLTASRQSEDVATPKPIIGALLLAAGVIVALAPWRGYWALAASGLAVALLFVGAALITPVLLQPTLAVLRPILLKAFGVAGKLGASFTQRNAARNGVAIGAVIVGMGITIGVGAMVSGINYAIDSWVATTIVGDLFVTTPVGFPDDFEQTLNTSVEGVNVASGVGVRIVRFEQEDDASEDAPAGRRRPSGRSVALVLVDPERFNPQTGFGRFQFISGQGDEEDAYETLRSSNSVLAANTMLDRFGIAQGDTVTLRTDDGFVDFEVGGVVVDFTGGGEAFVVSIAELDRFGGGSPDLFVITVEDGVSPADVRDAMLAAFPNLYLDITLNQDYRQRILDLTQQTFTTTNWLLVLAVFIAALGVTNTLGMNLSSRQHELAVLRTIGLSRGGLRKLIMAEGVVVVTLGAILGIGSGLLLSRVITEGAIALTGFAISPRYPWTLITLALLASPVVGLFASYLPARRAVKLAPVIALRSNS